MKISNSFSSNEFIIFLGLILVLFTNNYFSLEDSILFGARDGADYFIIADNFQNIPENTLQYQKAWRFLIPTIIGIISKITNLETYFLFRFFTILCCLSLTILFILTLKKFDIDNFNILFLTFFIICNPYLFRYFLAAPTMLNDLIFINAGILIILGLKDNKKWIFYLGFIIALITRQNSVFFLVSIVISKLLFKKNSVIKFKDIVFTLLLTLIFFLINNKFANNHSTYNETYSLINRFHLFTLNFTILDFIKFNLFPLIILLPPILYLVLEKKFFKFDKIKDEIFIIIFLIVFFTISVAYVGGPVITGKNLIRLINLNYPLIIIMVFLPYKLKNNTNFLLKYLLYIPIFLFWSFHPTFSKIKIFNFLKFNFF